MAASFPVTLPSAVTTVGTNTLDEANHNDDLHVKDRDEIRALGTKLGLGSSVASSYTLMHATGGTQSVWQGYTQLPAGSAGLPTYGFAGSMGTLGMYAGGTNTLSFATAGTLRMSLDSTGLSMGTNLPVKPGAISGTPAANSGYQESLVKGWINYSQAASPTINDSFNVSSISRGAAGVYTVNWDRDFATANYSVSAIAVSAYAGSAAGTPNVFATSLVAGSSTFACVDSSSWTGNDGFERVTVIACGKQ